MTDLRFEKPRVERVELSEDGSYGKYTVAPLQRGYGTTLGNSLRRMMLSSLTVGEIEQAILSEDVNRIKSVKGIGLKSAQRLILELKDKVVKGDEADVSALFSRQDNKATEEATAALIMLGFTKSNVTKAVNAVLKEDPTAKVETLIRKSLQHLS